MESHGCNVKICILIDYGKIFVDLGSVARKKTSSYRDTFTGKNKCLLMEP
jgi:hypothetical protein